MPFSKVELRNLNIIAMKERYNWLITSSADPRNTSLAVKGALTIMGANLLHAAVFACTLSIVCAPIDQTTVDEFVAGVSQFIELALLAVGVVITLIGLVRKVINGRWTAAR